MPSCAFNGCTNSSKTKSKTEDITFHSFPLFQPQRQKWILALRQQRKEPDWEPNNNSRICSIHLRNDDMYTTNKGYRRVNRSAVPVFEAMDGANPSTSMSQNSTDNDDKSNLNLMMTETPTEIYLKKRLSKASMRNRRLVQDNINLNKKNLRLIRTCKRLKDTVAQLKTVVKSMVNK